MARGFLHMLTSYEPKKTLPQIKAFFSFKDQDKKTAPGIMISVPDSAFFAFDSPSPSAFVFFFTDRCGLFLKKNIDRRHAYLAPNLRTMLFMTGCGWLFFE